MESTPASNPSLTSSTASEVMKNPKNEFEEMFVWFHNRSLRKRAMIVFDVDEEGQDDVSYSQRAVQQLEEARNSADLGNLNF